MTRRVAELHPPLPTYSVVVPVYRSAAMLPELHRRLTEVMEGLGEPFELIFVEDCGLDGSWDVVCDLARTDRRLVGLQLMRNSGQGSATLAGMARTRGEFVVTLDDDLQHPPEEIPRLVEALRRDDALDVVIGVPIEKRHALGRRIGSAAMDRVNNWFLGKDPGVRFTGFRVMRRLLVEALLRTHVPYPAIGPMIVSVTPRIANVAVRHDARASGRSGYNVRRMVQQTLGNVIGYSVLPLHLLSAIGAVGIVVSALFGLYFLARYVLVGIGVPGWTTLLLLLLGISGFNFFAFSLIGEYILRIARVSSNTSQCVVRAVARGGSAEVQRAVEAE